MNSNVSKPSSFIVEMNKFREKKMIMSKKSDFFESKPSIISITSAQTEKQRAINKAKYIAKKARKQNITNAEVTSNSASRNFRKSNKKCRYGAACRHGINCHFYHEPSDFLQPNARIRQLNAGNEMMDSPNEFEGFNTPPTHNKRGLMASNQQQQASTNFVFGTFNGNVLQNPENGSQNDFVNGVMPTEQNYSNDFTAEQFFQDAANMAQKNPTNERLISGATGAIPKIKKTLAAYGKNQATQNAAIKTSVSF